MKLAGNSWSFETPLMPKQILVILFILEASIKLQESSSLNKIRLGKFYKNIQHYQSNTDPVNDDYVLTKKNKIIGQILPLTRVKGGEYLITYIYLCLSHHRKWQRLLSLWLHYRK
ncbi:Uncharacterised protein [uncultured archaeon]|nr:Uncharacterised protein [uncultured archaeon]